MHSWLGGQSTHLCHPPLLGQVYGASNVELITRTRTEHLSDQHKGKSKGGTGVGWAGRLLPPALALTLPLPTGSKTPLQSFLGIAEQHVGPNNGVSVPGVREGSPSVRTPPQPRAVPQTLITQTLSHANPTAITPEEYFNPNFELGNRDMGRPMELTTKTQK